MAESRRICFVTYEIHPTTWGGCGVLLHHAAELLLAQGHEVVFLLDVPPKYVDRFRDQDRLELPNPERCTVYGAHELVEDFPYGEAEIASPFQYKALRFAHAIEKLLERERIDFVEFFEYCGVGYYAFARKLYGRCGDGPVLGVRLHNSIELIDGHEATKVLTIDRYLLYALERAAIAFSEAALGPTRTYVDAYYVRDYDLDASKTVISQSPRSPFPEVSRKPPEERDEIVYFGRVFQFKGVDKLLHMSVLLMERRPDFTGKVVFIGQDSRESPEGKSHIAYLKRLIPAALADRFEFTGQLTHEQTAERLSRARLGVFPNEFESFCYALHEVYHAGVPVVIADLPGFADFYEHERNCLVCDGSVDGLLAATERLLDDPALAERLSCPHPVANQPLGDWYSAPKHEDSLERSAEGAPARVLTVVLDEGGDVARTLAALDAQGEAVQRVLVFEPAAAEEGGGLPFLGRRWRVRERDGAPASVTSLCTEELLWVLEAGDRPAPEVVGLVRTAFARRPALGFAGTWLRCDGVVQPSVLDIAPEVFPYRYGPQRTRCFLPTDPGRSLVDLFDYRHGGYGEIGYIWKVSAERGPGCLLPEPRIDVDDATPRPIDPIRLSFLVMTQRDPDRLRRLARYSTVIRQDETAEPPSRKRVKRLALKTLGAGALFKLGLKRLFLSRRR